MTRWGLLTAASALFGAVLWHLPATAQHPGSGSDPGVAAGASATVPARLRQPAPRPVTPQLITFAEYREFRLNDIAQRRAALTRRLAVPDLSAAEKASLEARKAYYDRLAAMPSEARDRLFHTRFDEIDANHDGMIDNAERAQWRQKQRAHYRELAADHLPPEVQPH